MALLRLEDLFITYGDEKYAELAVFLDLLRALQLLYQTAHWQASGPNFYSDHKLFERLYKQTTEDIDAVGEKAVCLGSERLVDYRHSLENMTAFLGASEDQSVCREPALETPHVSMAHRAETAFLKAGEKLFVILKDKGQLTKGVENLLGGILDKHESNLYLLKQRLKN